MKSFPDVRVLNDPYDVQFGQGEWTVALGKLDATFTRADADAGRINSAINRRVLPPSSSPPSPAGRTTRWSMSTSCYQQDLVKQVAAFD